MSDEFLEKLKHDIVQRIGLTDEELITVTDYQSLDNGAFEVVVFHDADDDSNGFLVMLHRENLQFLQ